MRSDEAGVCVWDAIASSHAMNDPKISAGTLSLNSSFETNPSAPTERARSGQSGNRTTSKSAHRGDAQGSLADGTTALNIVRLLGSFIALNTQGATCVILGKFAFAGYQENLNRPAKETRDTVRAKHRVAAGKNLRSWTKIPSPAACFQTHGLWP